MPAKNSRSIWMVIPAFDRGVLERVGGKTLLEIAVRNSETGRSPSFRYVFVATHDEQIAGEARRLGADLPRRVLMDRPEDEDLRSRSFHAVDFLSRENDSRIWRWGVPEWFVSIDPFFPCQSYVTIKDIYDGCRSSTMAVPVIDVFPGLVMPVWSVFGHRYGPPGTRPHEDYERFLTWNDGENFTVEMVRVGSMAETLDCRDRQVQSNFNNLLLNRAFRLPITIGAETCYVPTGTKSWGALIPKDADFVYDARHDVRLYKGDRHGERNGRRREVFQ